MITLDALPWDVRLAMRAHAATCYPNECCGVVLHLGPGFRFFGCTNVDPEPAHGFRVGAADLEVIGLCVRSGAIVAAIYHSHVDRPAIFSRRDRHYAASYADALHVVFGVTENGVISEHSYRADGICLDEMHEDREKWLMREGAWQ